MGALLQERLARGEQAAFAELYDACADRLHHYLLVRLGSRTDADDALQETFLRLARTRERLAKVESLEAAVGQRLLKRAAIGAGRAHRQARMEMKLLQAGQLPNRRCRPMRWTCPTSWRSATASIATGRVSRGQKPFNRRPSKTAGIWPMATPGMVGGAWSLS